MRRYQTSYLKRSRQTRRGRAWPGSRKERAFYYDVDYFIFILRLLESITSLYTSFNIVKIFDSLIAFSTNNITTRKIIISFFLFSF